MKSNGSGPKAITSAHYSLLDSGAVMGSSEGWDVPLRFSDPDIEILETRSGVGMVEQSHLTKLRIQGPSVRSILEGLDLNLPVGRVSTKTMETNIGPRHAEISRLSDNEAWITGSTINPSSLKASFEVFAKDAVIFDLTSTFSSVRLIGPDSDKVVESLTDLDLRPSNLPNHACAQTTLAEVFCMIVRCDMGDLSSYRLFFGREYGVYVWESLVEAGNHHEMALIGIETLKRLEAGA